MYVYRETAGLFKVGYAVDGYEFRLCERWLSVGVEPKNLPVTCRGDVAFVICVAACLANKAFEAG